MSPSKLEKKLQHCIGKAISDYNMIQRGDRVMLCLSGGKDSFTLLTILNKLRIRSHNKFELFSYTLDQSQPGWDDSGLREWLAEKKIPHVVETRDTYSIVIDKVEAGKTYCSMCSRLRRGNIYRYASDNGFNKIALGHHRDDLIESTLMSMLYSGEIRSMPPKLLTDNKRHIVIRPMAFCQEKDIKAYAEEQQYPVIPCNLCGSQKNMTRAKVKQLISDLTADNPTVPGNMLNALGNVQLTQLLDSRHQDFVNLESQLESGMIRDDNKTTPDENAAPQQQVG